MIKMNISMNVPRRLLSNKLNNASRVQDTNRLS
jgi:hypothetical protein